MSTCVYYDEGMTTATTKTPDAPTTTTMPRYGVLFHDGTTLATDDATYSQMTDLGLRARGVAAIDRWIDSIDDYVQVRRTYDNQGMEVQ